MRHQSSWHSIVQPASSRARVPRLFFFSREGVFTGQDFSTQVEEHHLIHGLVPGLPLGAAVNNWRRMLQKTSETKEIPAGGYREAFVKYFFS